MGKTDISNLLDEINSTLENRKQIIKKNTSRFLSEIQFRRELYLKAKNELNKYLAHDYNVFDFINPDERKLSDIIAFLLDPNEKHGQNVNFLYEFLCLIKGKTELLNAVEKDDLNNSNVYCEYFTWGDKADYKIIDIFIVLKKESDEFVIAIENKPFVGEHHLQVNNYIDFLEGNYLDKYVFVFLSRSGDDPVSIIDYNRKDLLKNKGTLVSTSYADLIKKWLDRCFKECEAEKIRWFIKDFIQYVDKYIDHQ